VTPEAPGSPGLRRRAAVLAALAATFLHAAPAAAIPIFFDGPSGFGLSQSSADSASGAGVPTILPTSFQTGSALGISVPDPVVLEYDQKVSPTFSDPSTAHSQWTVNHTGAALAGVWVVFLRPIDYTPPGGTLVDYDPSEVGLDLSGPEWALVPQNTSGTQYYYLARRLGDLGTSPVKFDMYHLLADGIVQQASTLRLPRYQLSFLVDVPEPALFALLGAVVFGLSLRRRRPM